MAYGKDVKFIRKGGRIIPIKGKGSAPKGVSKRYGAKRQKPKVKKLSGGKRAAITTFGTAVGALAGGGVSKGKLKLSVLGGLAGGILARGLSGITYTKRGKGESKKQLAKRLAKHNSGF